MATSIKMRKLGQNLQVSALGLGCMGMSEFYGHRDDQDSLATLHAAIDRGVNFWDTADAYGMGDNERLVGQVLRERRKEIFLATKFGIVRDPSNPTARGFNGRPEYVRQACDASLKRLGIDVIDLYYQHRVDTSVPIEETVGAMAELVRAGKVRYLGLSEAGATTLRRAHKVHPITAIQSEYSIWTRDPEENGVLETCQELGVTFVAYSPLGRGFLTGQIKKFEDLEADDYRRFSPRFQGENFKKNLDLVHQVEAIAARKKCTTAQLALAWVLAQRDFIIPIPGTKKISRLEENIGALSVALTKDDLREISEAAPKNAVSGDRYPAAMMGPIGK